jgi:hypothetical protein
MSYQEPVYLHVPAVTGTFSKRRRPFISRLASLARSPSDARFALDRSIRSSARCGRLSKNHQINQLHSSDGALPTTARRAKRENGVWGGSPRKSDLVFGPGPKDLCEGRAGGRGGRGAYTKAREKRARDSGGFTRKEDPSEASTGVPPGKKVQTKAQTNTQTNAIESFCGSNSSIRRSFEGPQVLGPLRGV